MAKRGTEQVEAPKNLAGRLKDGPLWRASLEDIRSGELLGFTTLAELFSHLETEFKPPITPDPTREMPQQTKQSQ